MGITDILSLLGGLALFLYGMQMMSTGLEAAAGNKMKSILEKLTSNRIKGVLVGAGITAVISSVYMLAGKGRLVPQLKKILYAVLPKRRADWLLDVCSEANRIFVGFINGKLIDSAIIGVLCFILCLIFRIPYPMLVSVVVGVTKLYNLYHGYPYRLVTDSPYFYLALTSMILGTQLFLTGFVGELISRNAPERNQYQVSEVLE